MADKFTEVLDELKDALTNGEELEAALAAVATDHDLKLEALRNRAVLRWGDLKRQADEFSSNAGIGLKKKMAAARLDKYRIIQLRINCDIATKEDYDWYAEYSMGLRFSARSLDRKLIDQD